MTELIGCFTFLWACAVIAGLVMIEFRLSKMQRMMTRQLSLIEAQWKAAADEKAASLNQPKLTSPNPTSVRVTPPKGLTPPPQQ